MGVIAIANKVTGRFAKRKGQVTKFGHSLGADLDRTWSSFHFTCQLSPTKPLPALTPEVDTAVRMINVDGLCTLGVVDCSGLSRDVIEAMHQMGSQGTGTSTTLERACSGDFAEPIMDILDYVSPSICGYFGSWFQPYCISIQWNLPGEAVAESSFGWHIDDNPAQIMKVFVYLNDVTAATGAFRAFPRAHSRSLLKMGFKSWKPSQRILNGPLVNDYMATNPDALRVLEGRAGTVLMFDNNLVHKATPPESGERFVIQIVVYPSHEPMDAEQVFKALTRPILSDYPKNPAVNDIAGQSSTTEPEATS